MKKMASVFLAVLLALSLLFSSAFADESNQRKWRWKLSTLDPEELHDVISAASSVLLSKSEWESVTVPVGFYVVGEDIPAGHWSISFAPGEYALIEYFHKTDATGKKPADLFNDYYSEGISDPSSSFGSIYSFREIDLDLQEGWHVVITYGSLVFKPYTGRFSPFR